MGLYRTMSDIPQRVIGWLRVMRAYVGWVKANIVVRLGLMWSDALSGAVIA